MDKALLVDAADAIDAAIVGSSCCINYAFCFIYSLDL